MKECKICKKKIISVCLGYHFVDPPEYYHIECILEEKEGA